MGFDQCEIAEDVAARPVGNDRPGVEQDRARAESRTISRSWVAISLVQARLWIKLDEPATAARVEVGGRLVEDEDRGVARQDAGQARSLPLAEAQVMRRTVGLVSQLDPFQAIEGDPAGFGRGFSQVERPERDILDDRVAEELVVRVLKDQADPPADLGGVAIIDLQAVDPDAWSPPRRGRWSATARRRGRGRPLRGPYPARGRSSARAACSCPRRWARPARPTRRVCTVSSTPRRASLPSG